MTAVLPTQTEVRDRYVPLRVENGRVVDGPFAGATATRDMRWDCAGRRCFEQSEWIVHDPICERDHAQPPERLPNPNAREERLIAAAEAGDVWVEQAIYSGGADRELMARQARAARGGAE